MLATSVSFAVTSFGHILCGFLGFALRLRAFLQLVVEMALGYGSPLLLPVLFSPSTESGRQGTRFLRPISLSELQEFGDMFAPILLEHSKHESCRNPGTTIAIIAGGLGHGASGLLSPLGEVQHKSIFARSPVGLGAQVMEGKPKSIAGRLGRLRELGDRAAFARSSSWRRLFIFPLDEL